MMQCAEVKNGRGGSRTAPTEVVEKAQYSAIPLLVLRSPPLRLTLSSGEAAYRRAQCALARKMRSPILRYGAYAPTQDEGSGCLE